MGRKLRKTIFISAITGLALYSYNNYINKLAVIDKQENTAKETFYDWKFGKIKYKVSGKGFPVLLIHALSPESSMSEWSSIEKKLSETNKVYEIDLLGCGDSDKPKLTYSNFLYVKLLNDFVKDIIKEKTDIVATSSAATIIISALAYESKIYNKIVLINPSEVEISNCTCTKACKVISTILRLPIIGDSVYNLLMSKKILKAQIEDRVSDKDNPKITEYIDKCYKYAHVADGNGRYLLSNIMDKMMSFNISHCLTTIDKKIKIITGAPCSDNEDTIEIFRENLNSVEICEIEDACTLPQIESPETTAKEIINFISDTEE